MCLQWCHVRCYLFDNDVACSSHCPPGREHAHDDDRCESCRHLLQRPGRPPLCRLTRQRLPRTHTCCHWNVAPRGDVIIWLSPQDMAPGLMRVNRAKRVAELFDERDTAPDYEDAGGGCIKVELDRLSIPWAYGVPSGHWAEAIESD